MAQPASSAGGVPGWSLRKLTGEPARQYREHADSRMIGLKQDRYSWWVAWREVAEYLLPRRYRWLVTPNEMSRGAPINQSIIDPEATLAARTCAAGMMSGITSPSRPWFELTIPNADVTDNSPVKLWLSDVTARMESVLAGSNYYTAKATQLLDEVVFGTAPMVIYEDAAQVIRCVNMCAGEYYLALGANMTVDTLGREITMTVAQAVAEFGLDAVSTATKAMFQTGGASLSREIKVCHLIEPNDSRVGGGLVPDRFPWREAYWESGQDQNRLLRARGYHECPFSAPRWDVAGNDAYGRSPGMDALGCTKQLQLEQRRKAQGIDKMVNPPLYAHASLKNQPMMTLPGGVTFGSDMQAGIKPIYEVQPRLAEMLEDIKDVRDVIKRVFFNDIFQMFANTERDITAFEAARLQEEKLIVLGPVIERNENESLDPEIDRVFGIMARRGLLPPAPPEIHGQPVQVKYVSMLASAQRAASTAALEQLEAFVGRLAAVEPSALDNIDMDEAIKEYANANGVSPHVVRSAVQVAQIRQQRAQQQAQQQALQTSQAAVQGANVLANTPIGQGSALDAMLGTGGRMAA